MVNTSSRRLLLIIDPQIDFITGSLAVPHAAEAMDKLADYVRSHGKDYQQIYITTDWHPARHCSFITEGGRWPVHCVQGTEGAEVYPPLIKALAPYQFTLLRKGDTIDEEEYSIFKNPISSELLRRAVHEGEIEQIDLCGIAGDICVLDTYRDGLQLFPASLFHILEPFCPSLDGGKALSEALLSK